VGCRNAASNKTTHHQSQQRSPAMAPGPPSAHSLMKRPCLLPMTGLVLSRPSPANQFSLTPWSPTPPPCADPPQNGLILIVCTQDHRTRSTPRFQGLPGPKTAPESICAPPFRHLPPPYLALSLPTSKYPLPRHSH
jgi:hypothetical protein